MWRGGQPGVGKRGTYQRGWSQNLNPNPVVSSVQAFLLTSEVSRGHQLVGRGAGRCRLAHRCSVVMFTSLLIPSSHGYCIIVMSILQMRKQFWVAGEGKHMGGGGPTHLPFSAQWESACQTPQPSVRAHSAPGSGTTSRPGSIRRKLQPSGESSGSEPGWGASPIG